MTSSSQFSNRRKPNTDMTQYSTQQSRIAYVNRIQRYLLDSSALQWMCVPPPRGLLRHLEILAEHYGAQRALQVIRLAQAQHTSHDLPEVELGASL